MPADATQAVLIMQHARMRVCMCVAAAAGGRVAALMSSAWTARTIKQCNKPLLLLTRLLAAALPD